MGDPDLNGVWDFSVATPLQRPDELGDQTHFTPKQAQAFLDDSEGRLTEFVRSLEGDNFVGVELWSQLDSPLTDDLRTSLIIEPADGKVPQLTDQAKQRQQASVAVQKRPPEGPEDRNPFERCILGFNAGPPYNGEFGYNNNLQIFQTRDTIALLVEMVNDARIVPLDRRPHLPQNVRQWRGDSRGYWDGDTLVVETRNFTQNTSFRGSGMNMFLTEKFTRVSDAKIEYFYRIDDPESFGTSWVARYSFAKSDLPIYEFACHEANRSMELMLSGARRLEAERAP